PRRGPAGGGLGRSRRLRRDRRQAGQPRGHARSDRRRAAAAVGGGRPRAGRPPRGRGEHLLHRRLTLRIASLEVRRYGVPLDPPFDAAWDPVPRTRSESTLVIVRADDGTAGYASGDALPDAALIERLLVGT